MRPEELPLSPDRLPEVRALLASSGLDGWLLYDFGDRNPIAHRLLGLAKTTRRSFTLVPRDGDPLTLRHGIEASAWTHVPWAQREYTGWRSLERGLEELLSGGPRVAMEYSPSDAVPPVDRVPAGVLELVRAAGGEVRSSADLVSSFHSRWTRRGLELHREAAEVVCEVAIAAYRRAEKAIEADAPIREGELMGWIIDRLRDEGLTVGPDCIVAGGPRSADPHYALTENGESLERGSVILIDLWGRHPDPGVFADQTWMGVLDRRAPDAVERVWEAVRDARDRALDFLAKSVEHGSEVRGYEVDRAARRALRSRGLDEHFTHRLGHSIDAELHGSGPDLDDLETRDERRLVHGVGFSVEPGVYLPGDFGVRSEVNVHWGAAGPETTPGSIQRDLLLFEGS